MKKLVFVFMACVAVTFASCGKCNETSANGSDSTVVTDSVSDSLVVDTVAVAESSLFINEDD